ncbi:MAG: citramalate synthase [Victivallales bacterium]|nr:citramalate synthase [Victivallales bacterium]
MPQITIVDSTLRDGAQGELLSFSVQDKLNIALALDDFGIDCIEAGTPASNPKDMEFFRKLASVPLKNARPCAFGTTRRKEHTVAEDEGLGLLLEANTPIVSIVGKASLRQVTEVIKATQEENTAMIADSISFLKEKGKQVFFDAEHFFDGFQEAPDFAMDTLRTALESGADVLCLCDTNGGRTPTEIYRAVKAVRQVFPKAAIGIHCHNDCGCAVANSMVAVEAGATQVQGTFSGYGERCGNADLSVLIPNLILKKGCRCNVTHLEKLCDTAHRVAEISNVAIPGGKPYVGHSAFAHKGGMHIDGMLKMDGAFEHISPDVVGNHRRYLLSEVSGRSTLLEKVKHLSPKLTKESTELSRIVEKLKEMEFLGYQFEAAEASLELLARRVLGLHRPHFELVQYKTIGEYPAPNNKDQASAMIEVKVGSSVEVSAALGNGPVNALDQALRKALKVFYPQLDKVHLTDYKVRVLDTESATAAKVRVLIDSGDGSRVWTTVGVSTDIIEASWLALADSIEYQLIE